MAATTSVTTVDPHWQFEHATCKGCYRPVWRAVHECSGTTRLGEWFETNAAIYGASDDAS